MCSKFGGRFEINFHRAQKFYDDYAEGFSKNTVTLHWRACYLQNFNRHEEIV